MLRNNICKVCCDVGFNCVCYNFKFKFFVSEMSELNLNAFRLFNRTLKKEFCNYLFL